MKFEVLVALLGVVSARRHHHSHHHKNKQDDKGQVFHVSDEDMNNSEVAARMPPSFAQGNRNGNEYRVSEDDIV